MQDAKKLYDEIYGKDNSAHVNVYGIEYQLGIVCYRLSLYEESETHFNSALDIQSKVYAANDGNHIDIANTYGEISKMEIRRGNVSKAVVSVLRQKDILTNLLNDSDNRGITDQSKLKQKLLAAMLILRSWTSKHESIMEEYEIERLNANINELQTQLINHNNNHMKIGYKNKEKANREKLKIAEKNKVASRTNVSKRFSLQQI